MTHRITLSGLLKGVSIIRDFTGFFSVNRDGEVWVARGLDLEVRSNCRTAVIEGFRKAAANSSRENILANAPAAARPDFTVVAKVEEVLN